MSTAGPTRPPNQVGSQQSSGPDEVTVQADLRVEPPTDNLQQEISRELDRLEQRIMRAIPEQSDRISRQMQQAFQQQF
jgi:hypothetical protein